MQLVLIATGFMGALTLVFLVRMGLRKLGFMSTFHTYFSPKGGCTEAIVREIRLARREILMQAYSFSCPVIAEALVAAKKRGVKVSIILDRANEKETYSELKMLEEHNLLPLIDAHHAIAHNKIIIIDRRTLLTGSFNFTRQAEQDNAENLLIVKHHPDILEAYHLNFLAHHEHAQAPGSAAAPAAAAGHPAHQRKAA